MTAHRANWKGFIKVGELTCSVALYTAASSSDRIAFHTINRKTGNRVRREFVDSATGKPVERDEQVKGYEIDSDQYIALEPEEIAAAVPESDKTLNIEAFVPCDEIDDVYFDKPYYLAPDKISKDAFVLLREGMRKAEVVAIARTVLFRRLRTVLLSPHGRGLIATTLNFDYEVRSSKDAFEDLPEMKIDSEMLELAGHIIDTKQGTFDARDVDDRYETALGKLVRAKLEGKKIPKRKAPSISKPADLLQALRESAGMGKSAQSSQGSHSEGKPRPGLNTTPSLPPAKSKSARATASRKAG